MFGFGRKKRGKRDRQEPKVFKYPDSVHLTQKESNMIVRRIEEEVDLPENERHLQNNPSVYVFTGVYVIMSCICSMPMDKVTRFSVSIKLPLSLLKTPT